MCDEKTISGAVLRSGGVGGAGFYRCSACYGGKEEMKGFYGSKYNF